LDIGKDIFFEELGMRIPDVQLTLPGQSFGENLADIFVAFEKELINFPSDAVVVLGDTNSSLAVIIAKRLGIPVYHLEAGNRSFDLNVPEEINRKIVDHASDFNLVYSEHARMNLIAEGIDPRMISLIGSPMREVLTINHKKILGSKILNQLGLEKNEYFLFSIHRQENVDNIERLRAVIIALNEVAEHFALPVIVSTHPRTQSKMQTLKLESHQNILWHNPFGFHDYCNLQLNSRVTISDSGSISEEAAILGFKAITFRDSMERPEALDAGSILVAGINANSLISYIDFKLRDFILESTPDEYKITDTSQRVVNFILSTFHNYYFWTGKRKNN
jgi:UDP-N-acetylglucosamine 2-epimerase (non-hydrolysing)